MQYRRARIKGGTYFFTVVAHNRRKILTIPENVDLLRSIFQSVMDKHPFCMDAIVLLPDHLHCLWTLPNDDHDFSTRWNLIKGAFSRQCSCHFKGKASGSRQTKREAAVWQRRFWEHAIRDENDFDRHVEYIHYNPVKHNLVDSPNKWPYSSFHTYVRNGLYDADWGAGGIGFDDFVGRE